MTAEPAPEVSRLFSDALAVEWWGDGDDAALHPLEAPLVEGAVENRRRQFAAGRACARRALVGLGVEPGPILRDERRAPAWPGFCVGSISHTEGYAVAVARRADAVTPVDLMLGIDAERIGRVGDELFSKLFVESERACLAELDEHDRAVLATAMFGAKESFYKAQFPVSRSWVGFHDVECRLSTGPDGAPELALHPATGLAVLSLFGWPIRGRWLEREDLLVSSVEAIPDERARAASLP